MVVRYEVDACLSPSGEPNESNESSSDTPEEVLTNVLSTLSISENDHGAQKTEEKPFGINIVQAGAVVHQTSLVKIKTRSQINFGSFNWFHAYSQLLLGQTKTVMIGVHRKGEFFEIREFKLDSPELKEVEQACQPGLRKLRSMLEELQNIVMERGKGARLSLVCRDGVLQLMERTSSKALLPGETLKRFDE